MSIADQVNTFLLAFEQLRLCSDDNPLSIKEDVKHDDSVGELCLKISMLHKDLVDAIPSIKPGLKGDVSSQHIARLRDYAERWERSVDIAMLTWFKKRNLELGSAGDLPEELVDLLKKFDDLGSSLTDMHVAVSEDIWTYMQGVGNNVATDIDGELESTNALSDEHHYNTSIGRFFWTIKEQEWDVAGIIRRNAIVPEIIVPSHVSQRLHNQAKPMLYGHLYEATQAFIVGSFAATVALLRPILEYLLSEHYGAKGRDLHEMINSAQGLPKTARRDELHKLRMAANSILHPAGARGTEQNLDDVRRTELEISSHLRLMRDMVEGVPRWTGAVGS